MMSQQRRWVIGLATSTSIFGLTLTSGLTVVAHYFVKELSRPHNPLPDTVVTWSMPQNTSEPPASLQRSLTFHALDGTKLRGDFWAQPRPAPTIILCHGYRMSRSHLRPAAAMQYANGYNVFFFDFRGHGDSESVFTSAGTAEVRDLDAALLVVRQQSETLPGKIIIHGFSMGAAVALLMPPQPDVAAIIADSPYARSDDVIRRLVNWQLTGASRRWPRRLRPSQPLLSALSWSIVAISTIDFRLRFGYSVVARPDATFKRWKARSRKALRQQSIPILLIHSSGDVLIPIRHARQIASEAKTHGVPLETYFVDAKAHCGAYDYDPVQYNRVLQSFLARHLQDDLPEQHRNPVA